MTEPNSTAPIAKGAPINGVEAKASDGTVTTSLLAPDMDLVQLAAEIWRHKWLIACIGTFFTLSAAVVALGTPETFRADALIQFEEEQLLSMEREGLSNLLGGGAKVLTELELIRSRLTLGKVVRENRHQIAVAPLRPSKLTGTLIRIGAPWLQSNPYPTVDDQIVVADLKVPADWVEEEITVVTAPNGAYRAVLPDETIVEGKAGQPLVDREKGLTLLIGQIASAPGKSFTVMYRSELSAIQSLRDALQLGERGGQTGLIELYYDADRADKAQRILDSIVNEYIEIKDAYTRTKTERSVTLFETQIPLAESAIRRAEVALVQYQRKSKTVDVKAESELLVKQIQDISSQLDREQIPRERERLLAVQENLRRQAQQLPVDQQEVANLTLELETAQQIYVQLMSRVQEMRVLLASTHSNVRLVDPAVAPAQAVAPRRKLIVVLGLMIGLFLGITIAGFRTIMPSRRVPRS